MQKQELEFPVDWNYKIITIKDMSDAKDILIKVLREHGINDDPVEGNESKTGKYLTYKITVTFQDKDSMTNLSNALSAAKCVKFLL